MKKVLFVIYSLGYGGAERSIVNLLNELSPEQYDVDLLLFAQGGPFQQLLPPGTCFALKASSSSAQRSE